MTLRSQFITRWNRHATRKLPSLLPRYTTRLGTVWTLFSSFSKIESSVTNLDHRYFSSTVKCFHWPKTCTIVHTLACTCDGDTSKLLYGNLFFRFEEDLSSPPLREHSAELAEITTSYKVYWKNQVWWTSFTETSISLLQPQLSGFPLHFRYSDIRHIVSTVESTGIHLCENEHVEYALAIYIHLYPNDVLSVWLYIASLIPK